MTHGETNKSSTEDYKKLIEKILAAEEGGDNNELLQWIYHDISEQVELEEMRNDMTAMLYHDLQSPLGNVISSLELLAMGAVGLLASQARQANRASQATQTSHSKK